MPEHGDRGQHTAVIAVVGRPNAGKSTLVNNIVGQKITITSRRAQTTRHAIRAIHTKDDYQFVFTDTPGISGDNGTAFLRALNKTARAALPDADLVLFMLDGLRWGRPEQATLRRVPARLPCMAVINKMDRYKSRPRLAPPFIRELASAHDFCDIVPMSCRRAKDIEYLERLLRGHARLRAFMFPPWQVTDRDMRFHAAELIREKILRRFNREVPYSAAVVIEAYNENRRETSVQATIYVEREAHKRMIIGDNGAGIREVGKQAREALAKTIRARVDLRLWVKVSRSWSTDPRLLREFGYQSA